MICVIATKYWAGASIEERTEAYRTNVLCEVFSVENCS